jgi:2-oxoglutarate ferredoxin oxidoreductase subunit beta
VKKLEDNAEYDPTDWVAAMEKSLQWGDEIPIGRFFERTDLPSLDDAEPVLKAGPLVKQESRLPVEVAKSLIDELM